MNLDKDLYTVKDVSKIVGIGLASVRDAIKTGRLKAVKFGATWAIRREDLEAYLNFREERYGSISR